MYIIKLSFVIKGMQEKKPFGTCILCLQLGNPIVHISKNATI